MSDLLCTRRLVERRYGRPLEDLAEARAAGSSDPDQGDQVGCPRTVLAPVRQRFPVT